MSPLLLVVTFIISWTITLFLVLPIGVVTAEDGDPLHDPGAPVRADMPRKFLFAALLAAVVTLATGWLSHQPWISFR